MAPIVYNLAIIGGGAHPRPDHRRRPASPIGVVAGSACHLLVQLPAAPRGSAIRWTPPRSTCATPRPARRSLLMVPRAIGLGATQLTFLVATRSPRRSRAGAVTRLHVAFTVLQIPHRGHRHAARRRHPAVAVARAGARRGRPSTSSLVARALRLLAVRHAADRRRSTIVLAAEVVDAAVRLRPVRRSEASTLTAADAPVLPPRPRRAVAHRRPRPGVLRQPGHADAGRRGGPRGRHQRDPGGRCSSGRWGWPGSALGDRGRRLGRGAASCSSILRRRVARARRSAAPRSGAVPLARWSPTASRRRLAVALDGGLAIVVGPEPGSLGPARSRSPS